jgi:hypothetical protein
VKRRILMFFPMELLLGLGSRAMPHVMWNYIKSYGCATVHFTIKIKKKFLFCKIKTCILLTITAIPWSTLNPKLTTRSRL